MKTLYVLYQEHDNSPHNVSCHSSQARAEVALLAAAYKILEDEWGDITSGEGLSERLCGHGEYFRIYRVSDSGSTGISPDCFRDLEDLQCHGGGITARRSESAP